MRRPEHLTEIVGCVAEAFFIGSLALAGLSAHTELNRATTHETVAASGHEQRVADGEWGSAEVLLMAGGGLTYYFAKLGGNNMDFARERQDL